MSPRNGFNKALGTLLLASLLILAASAVAKRQSPPTWGEVVGGLQMSIYPDEASRSDSKPPKFRVELRNARESDLILNLGVMLANGKEQYPNAIILTLIDAQGKSRRLDLREPGLIAGRLDPLVLPLPTGATFSILVDLDKYWAAASNEFHYKLKTGSYSLEAQFTGKGVSQQEANLDVKGIALMPYWMGKVTSNHLQFEVPSQ
jgi:hypothetical protein